MKHALVGEDELSYHVHDGEKNFLVAKKGLKEDLHSKIKGLPKYADGGIVEMDGGGAGPADSSKKEKVEPSWQERLNEIVNSSNRAAATATATANQDLKDRNPAGSLMGNPAPAVPEAPIVPEVVVPEVAAVPAQPAVPTGPNFYGQFQANAKKQENAIREAAGIQANAAAEEAKILEQGAMPEMQAQLTKRMQELEVEREEVRKEIDAFRSAGAEDKVDPNRVWNNMSTGNKVLATIGIILGGAGGGASGRNMALDVLNNTIDRDIKAQQANIDKKNSLYQINLARYKDVQSAQQATYLQLNALTQGKIAALAARSKSELAKVNAEQMIAQLQNQNLAVGQQLYNAQAARAANSVHPLAAKIQSLPENVRSEAWKELGKLRALESAKTQVPQIMEEAFKRTRIGEKITSPFQSGQLADTTKAKLFPIVKAIVDERMTDADAAAMVDPFISGMMTSKSTSKQLAKDLINMLDSKRAQNTQVLTEFGIVPRQASPAELGMVKRGK